MYFYEILTCIHYKHFFFTLGPCEIMNGGCEHVCLPSATAQATCKCDFGFILESDRKNCSSGKHFTSSKKCNISRDTHDIKNHYFFGNFKNF